MGAGDSLSRVEVEAEPCNPGLGEALQIWSDVDKSIGRLLQRQSSSKFQNNVRLLWVALDKDFRATLA